MNGEDIKFWEENMIEAKLGEGTYSKVYKIVNLRTGQPSALKEIKKRSVDGVLNELLPPYLIHPNIVRSKILFCAERPIQLHLIDKEQKDEYYLSSESDLSSSEPIRQFSLSEKDAAFNFSKSSVAKKKYYIVCDLCDLTLSQFLKERNDFLYFHRSENVETPNVHSNEKIVRSSANFVQKKKAICLENEIQTFCYKKIDLNKAKPFKTQKNQKMKKIGHFESSQSQDLQINWAMACKSCLIKGIEKNADGFSMCRLFCAKIFQEIVAGVLFLHKNNIVHRDIKTNNIFLKCSDGSIIPKVGDFGLRKTKQSVEMDLQALGLVYFEILYVFNTIMELDKEKLNLKNFKKFPPGFQKKFEMESKLILRCLEKRPKYLADTRKLYYDMTSVCETLRTTKIQSKKKGS